MPKCKNCPPERKKYYKGNEPSPKGLGYCAGCVGKPGVVMTGKDNNEWITKKRGKGVAWVSLGEKASVEERLQRKGLQKREVSRAELRRAKKKWTVPELKDECRRKGIPGYSKLRKAELMKKCLQAEKGKEKIKPVVVPVHQPIVHQPVAKKKPAMKKSELKKWTVPQLKDECRRKGISGYSKLRKAQLIEKCLKAEKKQKEKKLRYKPGTLAYRYRKKPLPKRPKRKGTKPLPKLPLAVPQEVQVVDFVHEVPKWSYQTERLALPSNIKNILADVLSYRYETEIERRTEPSKPYINRAKSALADANISLPSKPSIKVYDVEEATIPGIDNVSRDYVVVEFRMAALEKYLLGYYVVFGEGHTKPVLIYKAGAQLIGGDKLRTGDHTIRKVYEDRYKDEKLNYGDILVLRDPESDFRGEALRIWDGKKLIKIPLDSSGYGIYPKNITKNLSDKQIKHVIKTHVGGDIGSVELDNDHRQIFIDELHSFLVQVGRARPKSVLDSMVPIGKTYSLGPFMDFFAVDDVDILDKFL